MTKTFKEYYADPEFKEKHLKYITEKLPCECGCMVTRVNWLRHAKTNKHKKLMEMKELNEIDDNELNNLKRQVKTLQKTIEKISNQKNSNQKKV